jgi:hypothetical protein
MACAGWGEERSFFTTKGTKNTKEKEGDGEIGWAARSERGVCEKTARGRRTRPRSGRATFVGEA